ncbi:MAG TPA: hypothetical protein VN903_04985 [Polyangia bacterium]|jgi:hypothetical protein|nr:hypothetical protein [Polyangia bacterium]
MKLTTALLSLACLSAACVEIDGGAVEISWVIRSESGNAITDCGCASPPIATVRLELTGVGGAVDGYQPCADNAQCDFPCARQTGSTPFNIRETHGDERYRVSLMAVGADGVDLLQVMRPAPILREVARGQPTEVESMQLVALCATECMMNSSGVCARP